MQVVRNKCENLDKIQIQIYNHTTTIKQDNQNWQSLMKASSG